MSISYRSPIYYFYFIISPNSYGRKSDHVSFIQVFLKKLSLDHDPISVFQQEFGIHGLLKHLYHVMKVIRVCQHRFIKRKKKGFKRIPSLKLLMLSVGKAYAVSSSSCRHLLLYSQNSRVQVSANTSVRNRTKTNQFVYTFKP